VFLKSKNQINKSELDKFEKVFDEIVLKAVSANAEIIELENPTTKFCEKLKSLLDSGKDDMDYVKNAKMNELYLQIARPRSCSVRISRLFPLCRLFAYHSKSAFRRGGKFRFPPLHKRREEIVPVRSMRQLPCTLSSMPFSYIYFSVFAD
jgi:hypothetical protein